jgi:hypothetical protein
VHHLDAGLRPSPRLRLTATAVLAQSRRRPSATSFNSRPWSRGAGRGAGVCRLPRRSRALPCQRPSSRRSSSSRQGLPSLQPAVPDPSVFFGSGRPATLTCVSVSPPPPPSPSRVFSPLASGLGSMPPPTAAGAEPSLRASARPGAPLRSHRLWSSRRPRPWLKPRPGSQLRFPARPGLPESSRGSLASELTL